MIDRRIYRAADLGAIKKFFEPCQIRVAECHGSRGYIRVEKLGNLMGMKAYLSVFSV